MHAILRLIKDDRLRPIKNRVGDFCVTARRQTVHEDSFGAAFRMSSSFTWYGLKIGARLVSSCSKPMLMHTSVYTASAPLTAACGS